MGAAIRWGLLFVFCAAAGCFIPADRRCGPNQDLTDENVCICSANAVLNEAAHGACVLCPVGQVVVSGKCACPAGFVAGADGACVPKPSGLGEPCDPAAPVCSNPSFASCQKSSGGAGYCTKVGCAGAADCPSGYACDTLTTGGVCKRAPSGQGKACTGASDCAGTEALFCAPIINSCLVQGCSLTTPGSCFPGYLCCDLTALGAAMAACLPVEKCP